jgi:putative SbcD/Mre11-related phosphoesterase
VSGDVYIVAPYPALYIRSLSALVVSDLHLGLEEDIESKGVSLPMGVYPEIKEMILDSIRLSGAGILIILGDLKHEFGGRLYSEYVEVKDLVGSVMSAGLDVVLVRGNHDNFIVPVLKRLGAKIYDSLRVEGYCFAHGHEDLEVSGCRAVVIGHEHPTVALRDDTGVKLKFKAFIVGKHNGAEVYVLPSFNPLVHGTPINEVNVNELLSPILRRSDVDSFDVYVVDPGVDVVKFPKIRFLRSLIS